MKIQIILTWNLRQMKTALSWLQGTCRTDSCILIRGNFWWKWWTRMRSHRHGQHLSKNKKKLIIMMFLSYICDFLCGTQQTPLWFLYIFPFYVSSLLDFRLPKKILRNCTRTNRTRHSSAAVESIIADGL